MHSILSLFTSSPLLFLLLLEAPRGGHQSAFSILIWIASGTSCPSGADELSARPRFAFAFDRWTVAGAASSFGRMASSQFSAHAAMQRALRVGPFLTDGWSFSASPRSAYASVGSTFVMCSVSAESSLASTSSAYGPRQYFATQMLSSSPPALQEPLPF